MTDILFLIALVLGIITSLIAIVSLIVVLIWINRSGKADKLPEHYYKVGGTSNDDE